MSGLTLHAPHLSLGGKATLAMASVAVLMVVAILGAKFHLRRMQLLQEFQTSVRGAAGTTALALASDEISSIYLPNDSNFATFVKAREILERSREINGLAENEMYSAPDRGFPLRDGVCRHAAKDDLYRQPLQCAARQLGPIF